MLLSRYIARRICRARATDGRLWRPFAENLPLLGYERVTGNGPGRAENRKNSRLPTPAEYPHFLGGKTGLLSDRITGVITMKNQNPESRHGAGSVDSFEAAFSAVDLVDQIQRRALQERFNRAPAQAYPSLDTVRRAITDSD